jgi:hypothetical protein
MTLLFSPPLVMDQIFDSRKVIEVGKLLMLSRQSIEIDFLVDLDEFYNKCSFFSTKIENSTKKFKIQLKINEFY